MLNQNARQAAAKLASEPVVPPASPSAPPFACGILRRRSPAFWPSAQPPVQRCVRVLLEHAQRADGSLDDCLCACSEAQCGAAHSPSHNARAAAPGSPVQSSQVQQPVNSCLPRSAAALQMELLNCSIAMFPGEWCTPQLAAAAAFQLEQAAGTGTAVADGSTITTFGIVMEIAITSAANTTGACS